MASPVYQALPGGLATRERPAGLQAGAPLTRIGGPAEALGLVAEDLAMAERALQRLVGSEVGAIPEVAGHLLQAGGKRLRPALTALGARASGMGHPVPGLMCVGELIHLGSLLHDDVVDDGVTRRGRPAAHRVFGNAVSVLTGDFCLARAVLLASEEGGHRAVTALARAVTEMAEGEVLQLQRAGDLDLDRSAYLEVIDKKSAALIAWCAAAGAHARGDEQAAHALEAFGRGAGIAFQITDDVLDYRPHTGKQPGADLLQRKVTLPLLHALEAAPSLRTRLKAGPPAPEALPELMALVRSTGALDRALGEARQRVSAALAALDRLPPSPAREALCALGAHLVERAS